MFCPNSRKLGKISLFNHSPTSAHINMHLPPRVFFLCIHLLLFTHTMAEFSTWAACDGNTYWDSTQCVPCPAFYIRQDVSDCPVSENCLHQCVLSCNVGRYWTGSTCALCTQCSPGYRMINQCPGGAGTVNTQSCVRCNDCLPGQYITNQCSGGLVNDLQSCSLCTACSIDQYMASPCPGK